MLLRGDEETVLAIGQASHAWLSGQLARAWGNERFGAVTPREEVCLAATQHDIGMSEWDLAPTLHPEEGLPCSFMQMPIGEHLALWRPAPRRVMSQSRYAALLVSLHGTTLYERRDPAALPDDQQRAAVRAYLAEQRALQEELIDQLGAERVEVDRNRRLLFAWDALSLALCLRWDPYTAEAVPSATDPVDVRLQRIDGERFMVDPWPFADPSVEVRCEGRPLSKGFDDVRVLHTALERAPSVTLRFELLRA